jgi:hypothetical protein
MIRMLLFAACVLSLFSAPEILCAQSAKSQRSELTERWTRFAFSDGKDDRSRDGLLEGGEQSLELLLDLLCGPATKSSSEQEKRVARLLTRLGSSAYSQREEAARKLCHSVDLHFILERSRRHSDPEVAGRIAAILGPVPDSKHQEKLRAALLRPATRLLEKTWPPAQMKVVTLRNLDRLAQVEVVEHHWSFRPISPMLATLRYSADAKERDLLGELVFTAKPGAAEVAYGLLYGGLSNRSVYEQIGELFRKAPPANRYETVAFKYMDAKRPAAFLTAISIAIADGNPREPRADLLPRLYSGLAQTKDEKFRDEIYRLLYYHYAEPKARQHFLRLLSGPDIEKFNRALSVFANSPYLDMGRHLVPDFQKILRGEDRERRVAVLRNLVFYWREEEWVRIVMGKEAARFVNSAHADEREASRRHFLDLLINQDDKVYQKILESQLDAAVRSTLISISDDWKEPHKEKK